MTTFACGDRVYYDGNIGSVRQATEEGYLVRWESGEEIDECAGDLLPACGAGVALDRWPYFEPCRNVAASGGKNCTEHQDQKPNEFLKRHFENLGKLDTPDYELPF